MITVQTFNKMDTDFKEPVGIITRLGSVLSLEEWQKNTQELHSFQHFIGENVAIHSTTIPYEIQRVEYVATITIQSKRRRGVLAKVFEKDFKKINLDY